MRNKTTSIRPRATMKYYSWIFSMVLLVSVVFSPFIQAFAVSEVISDATTDTTNPVLQQEVIIGSNEESQTNTEIVQTSTSTPQSESATPPPGEEEAATLNDLSQQVQNETASTTPEEPPVQSEPASTQGEEGFTTVNDLAQQVSNETSTTTPEAASAVQDPAPTSTPETLPEILETADTSSNSTTPETLAEPVVQEEAPAATSTVEENLAVEVVNTNDIQVKNEADSKSLSGQNNITSEDDIEDSAMDTGDVNVYANVLNIVNTNLYNSKIVELFENFDSLSADILLNQPETTSAELAQDLVTKICDGVQCKSLSTFTLTNKNTADVENDISVKGHSGQNSMESTGDEVKRSTIRTGNVNAVVNVLNIVNANLVNSRWTIASINIFGDWTGDLVLPSEMYFSDYVSLGAAGGQHVNLDQIKKVVIDVKNQNQAEISNNVNTDAQTGSNGITGTGTPEGKQGDVEDSSIETGSSTGNAVVENVVNTNIFNGKWFLGIINTLGRWSGDIYSMPEQVVMAAGETGITFFSSSSDKAGEAYQAFEAALLEEETQVNIDNENTAKIDNNVDVSAHTGENTLTGQEVEKSKIITGNARALANILNFANTNLINSDLQVGLVNIFGNWKGNVVFGYPDLAVTQKLNSSKFPREKDRSAEFELNYSNIGPSSMTGSLLEWQYDPALLSVSNVDSNMLYDTSKPGSVLFNIGRLAPQASGKALVVVTNLTDMQEGNKLQNYARVSGSGPEKNKSNNESMLEVTAASTVGGGGGSGGSGGGGGGGSGSGGYSSPGSLLKIFKTNTAAGETVNPGSKVTFTLTIDNDRNDTIQNVVVTDTMRGPDGSILFTKTFTLGNMVPREEAVINYDLDVPADAALGIYTNTAYVEALGSGLSPISSDKTAISSFTVGNSGSAEGVGGGSQETGPAQKELFNTATSKKKIGQVKGASTNRAVRVENAEVPTPLLSIADTAQADSGGVPELAGEIKTNKGYSQFLSILILCFLIALGYAISNMLNRMKKAQAQPSGQSSQAIVTPILFKKVSGKKDLPQNSRIKE